MLAVRLRQPKHLTPPKPHQGRCLGDPDPAIHQIVQHAHPVDLRPAHRNHRHRPNTPHTKLRRVTSLSGPTVTSLSGVYRSRPPRRDAAVPLRARPSLESGIASTPLRPVPLSQSRLSYPRARTGTRSRINRG